MNTNLLSVTIKDQKSQVFNGLAYSVTSTNKKGKFDILPFHSNFISLIKDYIIIRDDNKKVVTIPINSGVLRTSNDKVNILIGI